MITQWLLKDHNIIVYHNQGRLYFSILLLDILEKEAMRLGLTQSPFQQEKNKQDVVLLALKQEAKTHKHRLMEILYQRDNKRGCFACGRDEDNTLEFVYMDTYQKTASVPACLIAFRFKKAETEARKCRIMCTACRQQQTVEKLRKTAGIKHKRTASDVPRKQPASKRARPQETTTPAAIMQTHSLSITPPRPITGSMAAAPPIVYPANAMFQ